jgi:hypothetical protein
VRTGAHLRRIEEDAVPEHPLDALQILLYLLAGLGVVSVLQEVGQGTLCWAAQL